VIVFSDIAPETLAEAIVKHPLVLKPLLAAANVAARAIERDLSIKNLDTYKPKLTRDQALMVAAYLKPFLPPAVPLPTLSYLDRAEFIDKEIRKGKGHWEKLVLDALNRLSTVPFRKRTITWKGDRYELDGAAPATGAIQYAVDIKRIEARRDIHKRSDEIVNKAARLASVRSAAKFGALIYYPFIQEHGNIRDRLRSEKIAAVQFASESDESITSAVGLLLATFGVRKQ